MNTTYLKEFTVLAEAKNFWEASERLYLNQSTLSKHIKSIESELGVPLFIRTTRRVELTEYGKALLPYAQTILRAEFEYSATLLQMQNYEKDLLTLGAIPAMAQYDITNLFLQFKKEYPDSNVRLIEDDPGALPELLYNRKCEIIFTRESKLDFEKNFLTDERLVRIPYMQDHLVALLPVGHPLSGKESISLQDLNSENFCMIKEGTMMYNLCVDACLAANFIPNISFTSHRLESIFDMVANGSHVALLMDRHAAPPDYASDAPWITVDITPQISSQLSLCYLRDAKLSKTAKNFIRFCEERFLQTDTGV